MKKSEKIIYLITAILIMFTCSFYGYIYYSKEKNEYEEYDDYVRGMNSIVFSYNNDLKYDSIRAAEASLKGNKTTKGDLIKNFADYKIIPILNYLNETSENEDLITAFDEFAKIQNGRNGCNYKLSNEILENTETSKPLYTYENGVYTYKISKKVIKKETYKNLYLEYLKNNNYKNVLDLFANNLYQYKEIKYDYNLNTLKKAIEENYDEIYQEHEDIIVEVIAKNLKDFSLQTLSNYFTLFSGYPQTCLKEMEEEVLNLEYKYTRKDRIYSTVKYYRYTYQLDLDYLKKQLEEKKYPLFYM